MTLSGELNYLAAFFGGILVSFTPCVYPLIPVSTGFIGIRAGGSKLKGFFLSLAYVSGLAVCYAFLGLLASVTGKIFGSVSTHPLTQIIVGILIVLMGVAMFKSLPMFAMRGVFLNRNTSASYGFAFIIGVFSGLLVSPCLTPVVGSILAYIATKENIFYGTTLLFVFGFGMGFTLIVAGTFSGLLVNWPKTGRWSEYIRKACALILIAAGLYFIYKGVSRL